VRGISVVNPNSTGNFFSHIFGHRHSNEESILLDFEAKFEYNK
jgi:hypothetical protein